MGEYSRLTHPSDVFFFFLQRKQQLCIDILLANNIDHNICEQKQKIKKSNPRAEFVKHISFFLKTHCFSQALKLFLRVLIGHRQYVILFLVHVFIIIIIYLFLSSFSFADGYLATLHVRLGGFWCSCSLWFPWIPWPSLPSPDTFSSVNRNIVSSIFLITCNGSYCCFRLFISTHKRLKETWL